MRTFRRTLPLVHLNTVVPSDVADAVGLGLAVGTLPTVPSPRLARPRTETAEEGEDFTGGSRAQRAPAVGRRLDPHAPGGMAVDSAGRLFVAGRSARGLHDRPRQLPARGMSHDLNGHHHAAV